MKKQVFYIHGGSAYGSYDDFLEHLKNCELRSPQGIKNDFWPNRLREDLGDECEVFMVSMPNSQNAKYQEWKIWFERHFLYLKDNVILIGWSQGALFLEKYLSEHETPFSIAQLHLVAPPVMYFKAPDGEDGADFNVALEALPLLANRADAIEIWHSEDDFVVPFEHGQKLHELLPDANFNTFTDRNHFLIEEFPELVAKIKAI